METQLVMDREALNLNENQPSQVTFRNVVHSVGFTCRLLSGSIFITGPTVLSGRVTSMLWLGLRGVRTWRGPAGARPKLKTNKEEEISQNLTHDRNVNK